MQIVIHTSLKKIVISTVDQNPNDLVTHLILKKKETNDFCIHKKVNALEFQTATQIKTNLSCNYLFENF